jgi:hypothetical protein
MIGALPDFDTDFVKRAKLSNPLIFTKTKSRNSPAIPIQSFGPPEPQINQHPAQLRAAEIGNENPYLTLSPKYPTARFSGKAIKFPMSRILFENIRASSLLSKYENTQPE